MAVKKARRGRQKGIADNPPGSPSAASVESRIQARYAEAFYASKLKI